MVRDLDHADIQARLRGDLGKPIEIHDEIDSTNRRALEWAAAGAPHGATVVADFQSAGRGRRGRTWSAASGSALLFSVVVRPPALLAVELIPVAVGVAIARALEESGVAGVLLKWPNDVLIGEAKVCGVLVESRVENGRLAYAVIGIGINVIGSTGELSASIGRPVTALVPEHIAAVNRAELLARSLTELQRVWSALVEGRASDVIAEAGRRSALMGGRIRIHMPNGSVRPATARGLTATGALEVEDEGRTWIVTSGEVERVLTET